MSADRIGLYRHHGSALVLDEEMDLVPLAGSGFEPNTVSADTHDRSVAQRWMNMLLSRAVNGDARLSGRRPSSLAYRYAYPHPHWWASTMHSTSRPGEHRTGGGPYTTRLIARASRQLVRLDDLYWMLNEAEQMMAEPPSDVSTERISKSVSRRLPAGAGGTVARRIRRDVGDLTGSLSLFVHGSLATGDYTGFSDVDDLVIVHRDSWESLARFRTVVRRLERAARHFQSFDPMQHHGHWVYSDLDLNCLDEGVMPLVVLDHAITVLGSNVISAQVRTDRPGRFLVTWNIVQHMRKALDSFRTGITDTYSLKALASSVSLVPALVAQLTGQTLDKRSAIEARAALLSEESCMAIDWATDLRASWPYAGGVRAAAIRGAMRVLPARREVLARTATLLSGKIEVASIASVQDLDAICVLGDECVKRLREAISFEQLEVSP